MTRKSFSGSAVPTTLSSGMSSTDLTMSVGATTNWPNTATGPFVVTVDRGQGTLEEKILISSYSGGNLTVETRGYDGTTAQGHSMGATVVCTIDAVTIDGHDAFVAAVGTVTPTTSAVGDSAVDGSSGKPADASHKHARESFATGVTAASAPGDSRVDGSSASPARADHKHARESVATLSTDLAPTLLGLPMALTGAVGATRYVGGTTSGAPATGTFAAGDFVIDQTGVVWVCTSSGSPGTWATVGTTGNPAGTMYAASVQTVIPSGSLTQITTLTALAGTLKGGVTVASNALTVPVTRVYRVSWQIRYQASGGGVTNPGAYQSVVYKNGAILLDSEVYSAATYNPSPGGSVDIPLAANDVLTLYGYQSSGVNEASAYTGQINGAHATWLSAEVTSQ